MRALERIHLHAVSWEVVCLAAVIDRLGGAFVHNVQERFGVKPDASTIFETHLFGPL
jgi:hypothetical protein